MAIPDNFELANDSEFRLLANFSAPPRAGRISTIEPSGQVRVETDDPDGGDVLAWPLNGFSYAVNDVVYIAFAANSPDTAIVIGAKAPLPTLAAGVLPAVKHFPGHGDTSQDSHFVLPLVEHPPDRLDAVEYVPFKAAIAAGAEIDIGTRRKAELGRQDPRDREDGVRELDGGPDGLRVAVELPLPERIGDHDSQRPSGLLFLLGRQSAVPPTVTLVSPPE